MSVRIELRRFAYTPMGTFGNLFVDGVDFGFTVELPWKDNERNKSCIPEGTYPFRLRKSNKVKKITHGRHENGYQICDVPGRTWIMFHPGNTMDDFDGCFGPGDTLGGLTGRKSKKHLWAVLNSQATFNKVMARLLPEGEDLEIVVSFDDAA